MGAQGIQGSCLSFPIDTDQRGTFKTVSDINTIVQQSIQSIVSTRQGERVMLPDYGIPDFAFEVMDSGWVQRVAYFVEQQIVNYEPLVDQVSVEPGFIESDTFTPAMIAEAQTAAISIEYTVRGQASSRTLVFPLWELVGKN